VCSLARWLGPQTPPAFPPLCFKQTRFTGLLTFLQVVD
jgi:hypothetical protein